MVLAPGTELLTPWGSPDFFGVLTRLSWLRGSWIASECGLVPERPNYDWKRGTQSSLGVGERDWRRRLTKDDASQGPQGLNKVIYAQVFSKRLIPFPRAREAPLGPRPWN